ncbi:Chromodomain-helicase-DNA-binding protein 1-like [Geodia barretti]|uniref:Chromodomain-helicase-DNA-binding protein 1-like n=1 Tax=Geodia barretti TaxID=519541 RepID=A0AA35SJF1_GEOBA|nr:Chromodomain-helicase-DNA-binding protein 1-like [Geodia barretti]
MYVYEGKDYSKVSESDKKTFDQLLAEKLRLSESAIGERALRSSGGGGNETGARGGALAAGLTLPEGRKRRQLSDEELEVRRKKRAELKAKRAKLREEQEQRKLEEKRKKREEFWRRNGYTSQNCPLEGSSEEEEEEGEEEEEEEERQINYVVGDVTQPQNTGSSDAIIIHCVDDSGRWGRGGLFSALSARSPQPQVHYELAGQMKDLHLGDAHIVPVDDVMSRPSGADMVALIVAQVREAGGRLSGIRLSALTTGLQRVARLALRRKGPSLLS